MAENELDSKNRNFSQRQGYKPLPQTLQLEDLSLEARTMFWNILYLRVISADTEQPRGQELKGVWSRIMLGAHLLFFHKPVDEWDSSYMNFTKFYKPFFLNSPFNEVFDFLEFLIRLEDCPSYFIKDISSYFPKLHLAYTLDEETRTIYPAATPQEGGAIKEAVQQLQKAGLGGAQQHLQKAAACINSGDWAGAVRESIHAVESVARQIAPGDAKALGPALQKLEGEGVLQHRALRKAFETLYGYTSDEQGVRHPLLEQGAPIVGQDEAVFMLGACASFASYLCRKQQALQGEGGE